MNGNFFNKIVGGLPFKKEPMTQEESIMTAQIDTLHVDVSSANIDICVHDKQNIEIALETYETGPQLYVSQEGPNVTITVEKRHPSYYSFKDMLHQTVRLSIWVPEALVKDWHIQATSGNIAIDRVVAHALLATTSSGHLKLSGLVLKKGIFKATSGRISMKQLNVEKCMAEASSGQLTFKNSVCREGQLSCTSGNIELRDVEAFNVSLRVTSGNIRMLDVQSEHLDARTTSGTIITDFSKQALDATVEATVNSGSIVCRLPVTIQKETRHSMRGVIGNGQHHMSLTARSGSIVLA